MNYHTVKKRLLAAYCAVLGVIVLVGFTSYAAENSFTGGLFPLSREASQVSRGEWDIWENGEKLHEEMVSYTIAEAEKAEQAYEEKLAEEQRLAEERRAEEKLAKEKRAEEQRLAEEQAAASTAAATSAAAAASASSGDQELLAALIFCEAGNQPYEGQVAVGAVVMNRVRSSSFPDTIREVIYQSGQFGPAVTGWLDQVLAAKGYTDSALKAARDALAGSNPVGSCLYFGNGSSGLRIGDHYFH